MHVAESDLKAFIIESGLVPRAEVEAAAEAESGRPLGDVLVSRGSIGEDALRRIQAYVLGIPFVDLKEHKIAAEVLALIPEPIARTHNIVSYKKEGKNLEVAMLDVEDLPAIDSIRTRTGLHILPRLTDTESMRATLIRYQKMLKEDFGDLIAVEAGKLPTISPNAEVAPQELKRMAEELPIVRIVDTLLRHAVTQGASDIHIEPLEQHVLVRYRIDGVLHDAMTLPRGAALGIVARLKVLASLKLDERSLPQDGRFKMETEADKVSLRVSTLPTQYGERVVVRVLREVGEGFTLEALGFNPERVERVHDALRHPSGIVLVVGPAQSGKSTMLYTLLDILHTPTKYLASIENEIKYRIRRITQTEVNPAVGLSMAHGLRALMRQDPEVIMVSALADAETTALAAAAAGAGRLVLAGMEAADARSAVRMLLDRGIDAATLKPVLRGVITLQVAEDGTRSHEVLLASPTLDRLIASA